MGRKWAVVPESWSLFQIALPAGQVEEVRFRAVSRHFCGRIGNPLLKNSKYEYSFNRAVITGRIKGSPSGIG